MPLDISIIICTYNRAQVLKETLLSFLKLNWDENISHELLVVDNSSKDNTKDVIAEFKKQNPFIKYIFEEKIGLSYARNRGIKEAEGEIITFVDDDIEFDKDWGRILTKTFKDNPEVWSVGGKNMPVFPEGKPEWINEDLFGIYGDIKMGEKVKYMEYPYYPYGLNMAFRKVFFQEVGLFDHRLGRNGTSLLSHEEADIFYRSNKLGIKTLYVPSAIIKHKIPLEKTAKKWILKNLYWQGISDVVFEQVISAKSRRKLLSEAYKDMKEVKKEFKKEILCNLKRPLKIIYWHVRKIKLERWAYYCHKIGKIRKKLFLAFVFKPLKP